MLNLINRFDTLAPGAKPIGARELFEGRHGDRDLGARAGSTLFDSWEGGETSGENGGSPPKA